MALSESLSHGRSPYRGVPENDDLGGAKVGLKTGYGQTKWVSEKLLFEAGRRGLRGHILRPGYVVGDSRTGGGYCITLHVPFHLTILASSHKYRRLCLAPGQGLYSTGSCSRYE